MPSLTHPTSSWRCVLVVRGWCEQWVLDNTTTAWATRLLRDVKASVSTNVKTVDSRFSQVGEKRLTVRVRND